MEGDLLDDRRVVWMRIQREEVHETMVFMMRWGYVET